MYFEELRGRTQLVCSGGEIDQVIRIASAVRAYRLHWIRDTVSIEGYKNRGRTGLGTLCKYECVRIRAADAWGYFRTLQVEKSRSDAADTSSRASRTFSIGGRNAIVEKIAMKELRFFTKLSLAEAKRMFYCSPKDDDVERRLLAAELAKRPDRVLLQLDKLVNSILSSGAADQALADRQHSMRVLASRLNTLPSTYSVLTEQEPRQTQEVVGRLMSTVLNFALGGHDVITQTCVCEAIYYWHELLDHFEDLQDAVRKTLKRCRSSPDLNVQLAAIVATAKLGPERHKLGEALLLLIQRCVMGDSPYLEYARRTVDNIVWHHGAALAEHAVLLRKLNRLVKPGIGPRNRKEVLLDELEAIHGRKQKGRAFEIFVFLLLQASQLFEDLTYQESSGGGWTDIVGKLRDGLNSYRRGFPVVFEVKSKHITGLEAVRQIVDYCDTKQGFSRQRLGIVVHLGNLSSNAELRLAKKTTGQKRFVHLSKRELRSFVDDPEDNLKRWLVRAIEI